MHSESVKSALYDIRDNILLAGEFVEGLTRQEFGESRLHLYAVTRALEIISEARRRLPDDIRDKHPELTGTNMTTSLRPMSGKRDGASSAPACRCRRRDQGVGRRGLTGFGRRSN